MDRYARSHFADQSLLTAAENHAGQERTSMADLLADLAEIDNRSLHVPMAYRSLHEYCTARLRLSEDAAYKRIQAARIGRRFPIIFGALAEGRLHLTGVCLLAAHLTEDNAGDLLEAAMGRSKLQIERLLAERFPKSDLLPWVTAVPASGSSSSTDSLAPAQVNSPPVAGCESSAQAHAGAQPLPASESNPIRPVNLHPRVWPLSAQSYGMQLTISTRAHDTLQRLEDLLGASTADLGRIIEDALDLFLVHVEKRKLGAAERPLRRPRATRSVRHVPIDVRRAVYQRDGGRCAFVSESGRRCSARRGLQFDHIDPVARGGESTVSNLRLLCSAHNQHAAAQAFGAEFMRQQRKAAAEAGGTGPEAAEAEIDIEKDIVAGLRYLGFSASRARGAAQSCRNMAGATLEERMRVALSWFRPRGSSGPAPAGVNRPHPASSMFPSADSG